MSVDGLKEALAELKAGMCRTQWMLAVNIVLWIAVLFLQLRGHV